MKHLPIGLAVLALWPALAGATQYGDTTPPGQVRDLAVTFFPAGIEYEANLTWIASGDDGISGRADHFLIRWSTTPFDSASAWLNAVPVPVPLPVDTGQGQSWRVGDFPAGGTFHFGIVAVDDVGLESAIAWISCTVPSPPEDVTAPGAVGQFSVSIAASKRISMTWVASGDDGSMGRAARYDLRWSDQPLFTVGGWAAARRLPAPPVPATSGSFQSYAYDLPSVDSGAVYYFGIVAIDELGHTGPIAWGTSTWTAPIIDPMSEG